MGLQFNGNGWIVSKVPTVFGTEYSVSMKIRLLNNNARGALFDVGLNDDRNTAILLEINKQSFQDRPQGLRIMQHIRGYQNVELYIQSDISLNEWHNVSFERKNNDWSLTLDDKTITKSQEHASFPSMPSYVGGCDNPRIHNMMLHDVCVDFVTINGKILEYNTFGDVTPCPELYYIDFLAVDVPTTLQCSDSCKTKYLNHITAGVPWDSLTCCNSGVTSAVCAVGNSSTNENPLVAYQSKNDGHTQCIFDRSKIDTIQQAKKSVELFGQGNVIQNAFCQSRSNSCPSGTVGGCSRYFSPDESGDYCRDIFNKLSDQEKDTAIANYCNRQNSEDCKCANRSYDTDYTKLKQGNPFSDSCWYIPCANSSRYLVPSEFKRSGKCPANICQIVFDISQAHDVDIDHLKADINCDFSGGHTPSSPHLWYYVIAYSLMALLLAIYANK